MFAHIILPPLARITLATHKLWACRNVVAGLAHRYIASACHNNARIFVSLHYGVKSCGMQTVIGVYLASADAYAFDVDKHLMRREILGFRCRYFLELNVFGRY